MPRTRSVRWAAFQFAPPAGQPGAIRVVGSAAELLVDLEERATRVLGMHLHVPEPVRYLELVRDPDAELLHALAAGCVIVALGDHHVAARTVPAFQVATARGALADRRDDFDELVPDGEQRVLEPESVDAGVAKADL